jgi:hypothetical protein
MAYGPSFESTISPRFVHHECQHRERDLAAQVRDRTQIRIGHWTIAANS